VAGNEELVVWNGQLSAELGKYPLPGGTHALGVTVLKSWRVHPQLGDSTTVTRDIAVTECAEGLCIVPIDSNGSFLKYEALYVKTPGGRPVSVQGDKDANLLFVADGTAGLTIIDLASLGASRDDDGDGIDDRVLATVDLGAVRAQRVAAWKDAFGKIIIAVAAGEAGVFIVDPSESPTPTTWSLALTQPDDTGLPDEVPIGPEPAMRAITAKAALTGATLAPGQEVHFKWEAVMRSRLKSCPNAGAAGDRESQFERKKKVQTRSGTALADTYSVPFDGIEGNELTITVDAGVCGAGAARQALKQTKTVRIPGTNPDRSAVQAALGIDMLRQMACLESGQCQFEADPADGADPAGVCPLFSGDGRGGVGVMQITVPAPSYADHWNWMANVNSGLAKWNYALPLAQQYPVRLRDESDRWDALVDNFNRYRGVASGASSTCSSPVSDVRAQFTPQQVAEDAARIYNGLTDSDGFGFGLHEYWVKIRQVDVPDVGRVELPFVEAEPITANCSYTGPVQIQWERSPCTLRMHAPDANAARYVENALLQSATCPSEGCWAEEEAQSCEGWVHAP
jgi:hypothetical protein